MTLRQRVNAMTIIVVAILVGLSIVTATAFIETRANGEEAVQRLQPAAEASAQLLVGTADMERGVSTYVQTGRSASLGSYAEGASASGAAITSLRSNLVDSGLRLNQLTERAASARQSWIDKVARPIIQAVRSGNVAEAGRIQTAFASEGRFELLRALELTLDTEIDRALENEFTQMGDGARVLAFCLIALGILIALTLSGAWWGVYHDVVRPLDALRKQLQTVAGGQHLKVPINSSGPPELRDVGDDAEKMRRRLVDEIGEAREARQERENEAPVVNAMRSALEAKPKRIPGIAIAGVQQAAEGLKGDWWDVFELAEGRTAIVVTDISGHGWPAAMQGLRLKEVFRKSLVANGSITDALTAGVALFEDEDRLFATMAVVVIDSRNQELEWANAGHLHPMVLHADLHFTELDKTGPLLSTIGGVWSSQRMRLAPDDLVIMWTDGVTESHDEHGEQLEEDGLQALFINAVGKHGRNPESLLAPVVAQARGRAVDWDRDDATLIIAGLRPDDQSAPMGDS